MTVLNESDTVLIICLLRHPLAPQLSTGSRHHLAIEELPHLVALPLGERSLDMKTHLHDESIDEDEAHLLKSLNTNMVRQNLQERGQRSKKKKSLHQRERRRRLTLS